MKINENPRFIADHTRVFVRHHPHMHEPYMCLSVQSIDSTAERAYSYNVYSRFLAILELNLVPFAIISLLFYPCYSRLLL